MSNAKPIAAMMQINQAVRFMPKPSAGAGLFTGSMAKRCPGKTHHFKRRFAASSDPRRQAAVSLRFTQSAAVAAGKASGTLPRDGLHFVPPDGCHFSGIVFRDQWHIMGRGVGEGLRLPARIWEGTFP